MKKTIGMVMSLLLVTVLVISACSSKDDNQASSSPVASNSSAATASSSPSGDNQNESDSNFTELGQFPLVKNKETLRVFVANYGNVNDFATNQFTQWLEEKTNVHIEWTEVPSSQMHQKLNIMLASGEYPDVIMGMQLSQPTLQIYGEQGVFIPINDLIDKYGYFSKQVFEKQPELKRMITAPDGNIYSLPNQSQCYHCLMNNKMWIYKPWLDKLGLKIPTTTDELEQVLLAFKTQDPNGNNKADEIPLSAAINGNSVSLDRFIINSFVHYQKNQPQDAMIVTDDGKIDASYIQPEFKQAMIYLKKLYDQGLIDPQSFTQQTSQLKKLVDNPDVPLVGVVPGLAGGQFASLSGDRWDDYVAIPPLKGPNGLQVTPYHPEGALKIGTFVITSAAKNPALAYRWGDAFFNIEIMRSELFGIKDVGWRDAKEGELGLDNKPAGYTTIPIPTEVQNTHWLQQSPFYQSAEERMIRSSAPGDIERILYNETKDKYEPYKQDAAKLLPPLWFSEEDSQVISTYFSNILGTTPGTGLLNEMIAKFTTGAVDIDKGWDSYVDNVKKLGLQKVIDIFQTAWDASKK